MCLLNTQQIGIVVVLGHFHKLWLLFVDGIIEYCMYFVTVLKKTKQTSSSIEAHDLHLRCVP